MFIGRTFNNYYLVWPLMGAAMAALLAVAPPARLQLAGAVRLRRPAGTLIAALPCLRGASAYSCD